MANKKELAQQQLEAIAKNRARHETAVQTGQVAAIPPMPPTYRPLIAAQSQGQPQTPSAMPPKKPEAAPKTWMPLLDPGRVKAGDKSKTGLAKVKLFDITPGLAAGIKTSTGYHLKPGDTVELGDIFPNFQEIFKPIFNPQSKEEAKTKQSEATTQWEQATQALEQSYAKPVTSLSDLLQQGSLVLQRGWAGMGKTAADIGKWGAETGGIAAPLTGVPQAVMNAFSAPSQMTEQIAGTAMKGAGIAPISPGQVLPTAMLAKIGSELAKLVGANDVAAELEKHADAPPSVLASLAANVVARQRAAGQDSKMAEGVLNALLGTQQVLNFGINEKPDAEEVIQVQADALKSATGEMTPELWKASLFAYEGPEYVQEAEQRLNAGEDWDTVFADIQTKLTPEARINDFVGQLVLDPLNVVDKIGGFGRLLGMGTRSEREAANAMRELVMATDEGAGLVKLADTGGDVYRVGAMEQKLRRAPVIGALIRPLPETISARRGEEASAVIKMITQGISPEAPTRLLEVGIDQHPVALAMEAFVKHNADDMVTGIVNGVPTPMSSAKVQEMLGLGARAMTKEEAAKLGAEAGSAMDMFRSNAADRARDWLVKAGDDADNLANEFTEMQKYYSETMKSGVTTITDLAGKDKTLTGIDAINAADDRLIKWLENVNKTYMKAAGVEEATGLYKKILDVRKGMGKIQTPFRFFHMTTNPGMSFRNLGTNTMLGWLDNFNMLTPVRGTQAEIGRLGLSGAGLARQLGAQSDVTKGLRTIEKGGIRGALEKISPMRWSEHFEEISGQRITLQAFQRHMGTEWRVGKAIPEDKWAEVATYFGDRADEARALLEGAWAPGEPQRVIERMMTDDTWRNAAKTSLNGTHDTDLMNDLDEILQRAPNQQASEDLINQYVQAQQDWWKNFVDRGFVMEGTDAAKVADIAQMVTRGLPDKRKGRFLNEFTKDLVRQDATVALNRSYTTQALEQLRGIDGELAAAGFVPPAEFGGQSYALWLQKRMTDVEQISTTAMQEYRPIQFEVFDAIKNGNWSRIQEIGQEIAAKTPGGINPFEAVTNKGSAWDAYFAWSTEFWTDYKKTRVGEMQGIYNDAAAAIQKVTGKAPPAVPENLIEKFLPLTTPEQRSLFAQLQTIMRSRGIERTVDLRDILQKAGLPHANRLFQKDIIDRNWYENAVQAIFDWSAKEGPASKLVKGTAEEIDDSADLAVLMEKLNLEDIDPQAMNMAEGMAAQMSERDAQIQKVLDGLRNAPTPVGMDKAAIEKLKAFVKEIEPRHTMVRAVGEQVATKARDFALLNYGDKRGIDLMAGMFYNYPKWYMGTMKNMISRALENPGRLAALIKFRKELRTINRDLPEWWQDQIQVGMPWGQTLSFNILASIDPLNGFLGDKYHNEDLYSTPIGAMLAEAQNYGPGLHGTWATFMALGALARGNREESMGWVGSLGPATRGITAITALAKKAGVDFLPAGGVVAEPWLWGSGNLPGQGAQMIGTPNDAKRVGMSLSGMFDRGEITAEQAYEAMLSQRGDIYDRALNDSKVATSIQTLASWLGGAGIKGRDVTEIEIQRMDADRTALMKAKKDGYYDGKPELYRQAWEEMRQNYPWMDFVQGFRRDDAGRANIYAMSVYDRMPPNARPYIDALMGGETEMYSELLDKFYGGEDNQKPLSIENLTEPEQEMFMSMMKMMGATLALPDSATGNEWNMARQARSAMFMRLDMQYKGATDVQDQYYNILGRSDNRDTAASDARAFLDAHGELQAYWDDKDKMIASDPLLAKYWGSMELFERVSRDEFERSMAVKYPGLTDQIDEYYRLRDEDPNQAKVYLKAHPTITTYWSEKDKWMVGIDKELMGMTQGITNLQGQWGQLRKDLQAPTTGQQRVVDLIESGSRPMGDFELPESLDAKQTQAGIQSEIDTYIQNGGTMGNLYRQLKAMGGLDKTLTAFQEFARGTGGVETIMANKTEIKALLAALSSMNDGTVGAAGTGIAGGATGTAGVRPPRQARLIRSKNYGGASQPAPSKAQQQQLDTQIDGLMAQIQDKQPRYWGLIYNMTSMSQADIGKMLEGDPAFRAFLGSILSQTGFTLQQMIAYFQRLNLARAAVSPKAPRKKTQ